MAYFQYQAEVTLVHIPANKKLQDKTFEPVFQFKSAHIQKENKHHNKYTSFFD